MSVELLEIRDLVVAFDAFHAIDGLDLTLDEHEVRFVIGPNGAGKTTLIDSITNLVRPTSGSIMLRRRGARRPDGVRDRPPRHRAHVPEAVGLRRADRARERRHRRDVPAAVPLAAAPAQGDVRRGRRGAASPSTCTEQRDDPAGSLSHGQKQWLEVAMVLVQKPRLLLLDEPVAGMTEKERLHTGELITQIAAGGHDGARHRARHGLRAPLRAQGDRHARGQDPHGGDGRRGAADETVREVYLGRPRDARGAAEVLGMSIEPGRRRIPARTSTRRRSSASRTSRSPTARRR